MTEGTTEVKEVQTVDDYLTEVTEEITTSLVELVCSIFPGIDPLDGRINRAREKLSAPLVELFTFFAHCMTDVELNLPIKEWWAELTIEEWDQNSRAFVKSKATLAIAATTRTGAMEEATKYIKKNSTMMVRYTLCDIRENVK